MAEKERRHEKSQGGRRRWRGIIKREGWSEIGEEEKKIAFKETESKRTQCPPPSNRRSMERMRFNVVPIGGNEK